MRKNLAAINNTPRHHQCPPLVSAPPIGTLRLEPELSNSEHMELGDFGARRRPVQIAADPRVYKGSVFANRRYAHNNEKLSDKLHQKEKKYRVGVIREQLSSLLPKVPVSNQQKCVKKVRKNSSTEHRISGSHSSARTILPGLSPRKDATFQTARFTPIRSPGAHHLPRPSKVEVNFAARPTTPQLHGRVVLRSNLSQTATPPCTSREVFPIVDSGVQTEENFDEKFDELIRELANSAITMAKFQIEGEEQIEKMRQAAKEKERQFETVKQKQGEQNEKWRNEVIEKNRQLEEWKKQESEARRAQEIALETCKEVTRKTLENMRIIEKNSKKSVGLDTREMNRFTQKMLLVTTELEKDFFPWIFHRAERLFRNRMVKNQIDHVTLNEIHHRRELAKKRLINMNSDLFI